MKVRLKREIVALGVDGISPPKKVGEYVNPKDWNKLINDPNTIVIDTGIIMRLILELLKTQLTQKQ